MTEANAKRLYEHFVKTGQTERAEDILKAHPKVKDNSEEEEPEKETKSKKEK